MRWPVAITVGLVLVVLVNLAFAWFAVSNPPEIVHSYETETR